MVEKYERRQKKWHSGRVQECNHTIELWKKVKVMINFHENEKRK
jgi:hypothetical protein